MVIATILLRHALSTGSVHAIPIARLFPKVCNREKLFMGVTPSGSFGADSTQLFRAIAVGSVTPQVGKSDIVQTPKQFRRTTFPRFFMLNAQIFYVSYSLATNETYISLRCLHKTKQNHLP
jgi:hypothetical protein